MKTYERNLKKMELEVLCREICDEKNATAIYNALRRHGVYTIEDLKSEDSCILSRFKGIGEMRLEFIKELKKVIEDEEKTQKILDKDVELTKMKNDKTLCEQIEKLYFEERYYIEKIARILGISKNTVMHFIR